MADFNKSFSHVMKWEGGYVNDPDDIGGETYKGISRKYWPEWSGWSVVDMMKNERGFPQSLDDNNELQDLIKEFYQVNFWNRIRGNEIINQDIAEDIFDFAVNAGVKTSSKLAQLASGSNPDGIIGKKSIDALNSCNEELFVSKFALNKIAKYVAICNKRKSSRKFFFGWVRRVMEGL